MTEPLRAALQASGVGLFRWHIADDSIECDASMATLFGMPTMPLRRNREQFLKRVVQSDRAVVADNIDRCAQAGGEFSLDFRVLMPDGSERWLSGSGQALGDDGTFKLIAGACTDVTERKRNEAAWRFLAQAGAALAASLDYETTLANVARLAVPFLADWCLVDLQLSDGSFQRVEVAHAHPDDAPLAASLRQVPPEAELRRVHMPTRALMGGQSVLVSHVDESMLQAIAATDEHFALLKRARIRSIMSVPMVARGHTQGVLTFALSHRERAFDATDLMLGEELARRAALSVDNARLYGEAQQAVRLRDDFLCIASHELRTPLTTLGLQADSALRTMKQTQEVPVERISGKLQNMRKQMDRLDQLIQGLLDVSRIVSGRLELHPETCNLRGVTEEVLERFADEALKAGCQLHLEAATDLTGAWDRLRLEQLITNLVTNAIRYGRAQPIDIVIGREGDRAILAVRDRGIGIAPENQERIFGRFERAASQRNYGGLGLGLWIVRQILEAMGGTIRVESALGAGSTFTVDLPFAQA